MSSPSAFDESDGLAPFADGDADLDGEALLSGLPGRLMRVKVLYTFDHQNNTTCLARLPHALEVPTVSVDEGTQIGVIELRKCIQAIVSASPELMAKLGQDYTVYAYDYSEYETPLVGQGMLSWMLATTSSTPTAAAHQSRTMITGRICKNILGLFSNGIKETLEVKLRLVPVPTCLQSEYLANMERYRGAANPGTDASHHSRLPSTSQDGQDYITTTESQNSIAISQSQRSDTGGVESIHHLLAQSMSGDQGRSHYRTQDEMNPEFANLGQRPQISRVASPALSVNSYTSVQRFAQDGQERPGSRASTRSDAQVAPRRSHSDLYDASESDGFGAVPRKRARLSRADWQGKSSFGPQAESLRVTASTAASIRVHRPVPNRPGHPGTDNADGGHRPPTPRPGSMNRQQRDGPMGQSLLRQESSLDSNSYVSPYSTAQDLPTRPSSAHGGFSEQQNGSPEGTYTEIPSSPPVLPQGSYVFGPSSPSLPPQPTYPDSGFMSGTADREEDDEQPSHSTGAHNFTKNYGRPRKAQPGSFFLEETPGPPELLPTKILPRNDKYRPPRIFHNGRPVLAQSEYSIPSPGRHDEWCEPNGSVALPTPNHSKTIDKCDEHPPAPSAEPVVQPTQAPISASQQSHPPVTSLNLPNFPPKPQQPSVPSAKQRSLSSSDGPSKERPAQQVDEGTAETAETAEMKAMRNRSGSGKKRKKAIEKRLATSIAEGTMPAYCMNCGAIETPTWRRAVAKVMDGTPKDVPLSQVDGEILTCEILARDCTGEITKFRIITKYVGGEERAGFELLLFCNPCGLYLNKMKCMRPPERWLKPNEPAIKRKGPYKRKKAKATDAEPTSDFIPDTNSAPGSSHTPQASGTEWSTGANAAKIPSAQRARSSSVQVDRSTLERNSQWHGPEAAAALKRAIQSSPARISGTQGSPIELDADITPKPTRRLLFPSPRKEGETRLLSDSPTDNSNNTSGTLKKDAVIGIEDTSQDDKENCPPVDDIDDEFAHLFEDDGPLLFETTPTKQGNSLVDTLKTPNKTSSGKSPTSQREWRRHSADPITPSKNVRVDSAANSMTPFTAELHQLLSEAHDFSSPSKAFGIAPVPFLHSSNDPADSFIFPDFNPDDLVGTDLPMPSSPPDLLFSLYEDPTDPPEGLWHHTTSNVQNSEEFSVA